jgi:hypothetical protein
MEEVGQKETAKLCRVPTAWVPISREVKNVPDYGHHCKIGLPQDVGRDNESALEASVFMKYLSCRVMAREECGVIRVGFMVPPGMYD